MPCGSHLNCKNKDNPRFSGRKLGLDISDEGTIWADASPLPTAFTGLSVVNFHYTTKRKGTSLASYFVQCQFVISTKKFVLCLVAGDVGEGYFSVRTPRENGRKKRTETIEGSGGKAPSRGLYGLASRSMQRSFRGLVEALDGSFPSPLRAACWPSFFCHDFNPVLGVMT